MDDSADSLGYISLATENLGLRTHKLSPAVVGEDKDTREVGQASRRGLTPRGSLECNPEIPAFPGEEN